MRIVRMVMVVTAVLLPACATKKAPEPAPASPPQHRPVISKAQDLPPPAKPPLADAYGDIPDTLPGTWLIASSFVPPSVSPVKSGPPKYTNAMKVVRISRTDGQWRVDELVVPKGDPVARELDKANFTFALFAPSAEARQHLAAEAANLSVDPPTAERIALFTPGQLPTRLGKAPSMGENFRFALGFLEKGEHIVTAGTTFEANDVSADKISGVLNASSVVQGQSATVVPLSFNGSFTMYRLQ